MQTPVQKSAPHPMMLIAAVAVVLFCGVGTAAIMGWLPSSIGSNHGAAPIDPNAAHPQAAALHEHLCCHHILVRKFDYAADWLRIGLTADAAEDQRLSAALDRFQP